MKWLDELPIIFIGILAILSAKTCETDTEDLEKIRVAVKLNVADIPALNGAIEIKGGEKPWIWKAGWSSEVFNVVRFKYRWERSDTDFVYVDLSVTENQVLALEYLTEKRETSSIPINLQQPEDQPTIAGEISYGSGQDFIRDNIVVEIRAEGEFDDETEAIARQIDALILEGHHFASLSQVKPVIKDFNIASNPVIEGTQTLLILNINDPNNQRIFYEWIYTKIAGFGGIIIEDDKGDVYFMANAVSDGVEANEQELSVFVINEYGFCSDTSSAIYIRTIEE